MVPRILPAPDDTRCTACSHGPLEIRRETPWRTAGIIWLIVTGLITLAFFCLAPLMIPGAFLISKRRYSLVCSHCGASNPADSSLAKSQFRQARRDSPNPSIEQTDRNMIIIFIIAGFLLLVTRMLVE